MSGPLRGAVAAAVTPLRDGGVRLDEAAVGPIVEMLVDAGLDGILALGTTGEGVMLTTEERCRAAERFLEAAGGRLHVAVHCGAQTTAEVEALAAHAAEHGASAVAVIAPPYYPFDAEGLLGHLSAAAAACVPLPFYVYEFAARSGYAVPVEVIERLREISPNLVGLKVSDSPLERLEPYLLDGLDVLVGAEPLVLAGMERGAVGAVSGLASAFPEAIARLVGEQDPWIASLVDRLKELAARFPVPAMYKAVLGMRGIPIAPDVRAPLRPLSAVERAELAGELEELGVPGLR